MTIRERIKNAFFTSLNVKNLSINGTAVTATADELNAIAGGGLSGAELGYLDGVTAGTVAASKAVVVDSNKRADTLVIGTLKLGASAGTAVTATAAEINKLAGSGATVASGTQAAHIADASTAHAINSTFNDVEVETALNALGTKINAILDVLEAFSTAATS